MCACIIVTMLDVLYKQFHQEELPLYIFWLDYNLCRWWMCCHLTPVKPYGHVYGLLRCKIVLSTNEHRQYKLLNIPLFSNIVHLFKVVIFYYNIKYTFSYTNARLSPSISPATVETLWIISCYRNSVHSLSESLWHLICSEWSTFVVDKLFFFF